jgi:PhnB protein
MPAPVKAIPDGYHAVTPYLVCDGAAAAIAFYEKVFGAALAYPPIPAPGGKIGHAELRIGDSIVMLADEHPVDQTFRAALAAGAKERRPVKDQFYGDRSGLLEDPFGHVWTVATHIEDVPPEELERRMKAMGG